MLQSSHFAIQSNGATWFSGRDGTTRGVVTKADPGDGTVDLGLCSGVSCGGSRGTGGPMPCVQFWCWGCCWGWVP